MVNLLASNEDRTEWQIFPSEWYDKRVSFNRREMSDISRVSVRKFFGQTIQNIYH